MKRPDLRLNLNLWRNQARLSLDLSGASLHRRGYRSAGKAAPLKENLAAAILQRAGWPEIARAGGPLLDPMCGSGTLPIEAALMAGDVAPGLERDYFGFLNWLGHDRTLWEKLLEEARKRRQKGLQQLPRLVGGGGCRWRNCQRTSTLRAGCRLVVVGVAHAGLARRAPHRRDLRRGRVGEADILGMLLPNARSVRPSRPR